MAISKSLYFTSRDQWRAWLVEHHASETEIWLVYYKKQSGQPRIPYEHAVEEALCFGWVDSIVKKIDDEKFAQKFTPRRGRSNWSTLNKLRVRKLIREGRMTESGLAKIDLELLTDEPQAKPRKTDTEIPQIVEQALRTSPMAWKHFQGLAPSYRRNYIAWVMHAKKDDTRQRRLREVVSLLEQNKKLGLK
jgi:uncharacterized protein YdeI (YjbR/CyaY-like superfamily)